MEKRIALLKHVIDQMTANPRIEIQQWVFEPGYKLDELDEIARGLEVEYNNDLLSFYENCGGFSLIWRVKDNEALSGQLETEITGTSGSINILNPFDMVMGKEGTRWENVLWFDSMPDEKKSIARSFVPFDFPSPELIAGFRIKEKSMEPSVFLYDNNDGITDMNIQLETYLDYLIYTKGYYYWQEFINDHTGNEFIRFNKVMPYLFEDFNSYSPERK
jgi:hypothetical protein